MGIVKKHFSKIISYMLLIVCVVNLVVTAFPIGTARAYSSIGSNAALGSPILNQNALSDNWNPDESVIWGIFLSNFCVPFVDTYESAFNLSSSSGSKGHGVQALSFGAGSDAANNAVIQELLKHAINYQSLSPKKISVSYNVMDHGNYISTNAFEPDAADPTGAAGNAIIRDATLRDLFMSIEKEGFPDTSWSNFVHAGDSFDLSYVAYCENYSPIVGVTKASLPTFAIEKTSGTGTTGWEIVFDYRESYDMEMFSGALAAGLNSQFRDEVCNTLNSAALDSILLYLDSFGNICARFGDRYVVIIPSAANQYITEEPSINMLNSLIFNAGSGSDSKNNLILNAGQGLLDEGVIDNFVKPELNQIVSGSFAFNNDNARTQHAGMAIFYDTDTLVMQDVMEEHKADLEQYITKINEWWVKWVSGASNWDWINGILMIRGFSNSLRNTSSDDLAHVVHPGKTLIELFDLDISKSDSKANFKIEPIHTGDKLFQGLGSVNMADGTTVDLGGLAKDTMATISSLTNIVEPKGTIPRLTHMKNMSTGNDLPLFEESIIIPVMCSPGVNDSGQKTVWSVYRHIPNFLYEVYQGKHSDLGPGINKEAVKYILSTNGSTALNCMSFFAINNSNKLSEMAVGFMKAQNNYLYKIKDETKLRNLESGRFGNIGGPADLIALRDIQGVKNTTIASTDAVDAKFEYSNTTFFGWIDQINNDNLAAYTFGRAVKLYYVSDILTAVSQILGVKDGTDFSVHAANIYLTYLEWYGLTTNKLTGEKGSNLNDDMFNPDAAIPDVADVAPVPSEEDMKEEVLKYSYLMLDPEAGRQYRGEIMLSNMGTWMYNQYQKIVYGGADTYYYATIASKNNTGFLSVDTYSENFMTAWFMDDYPTYGIILIAAGIILAIVIGILKKRKISWFLLAIVLVVNVVLILPSTGEIVPFVANNTVQSLFEDKMTYWSISEQISNAAVEAEANNSSNEFGIDVSTGEGRELMGLLKSAQSLYLDRYLSIKQDISNKITSSSNANYSEIQSLKSARWLLPTIMRQYTANDGSADYVYVPIGDKLEDATNLYWYYVPGDADYCDTVNSVAANASYPGPVQYGTGGITEYTNKVQKYPEFEDLSSASGLAVPSYRSYAYHNGRTDLPHTYFYFLDANDNSGDVKTDYGSPTTGSMALLDSKKGALDPLDDTVVKYTSIYSSYDDWAEAYVASMMDTNVKLELRDAAQVIMNNAGNYSRYDRATLRQCYGYLWSTESLLPYTYMVVKDSFDITAHLGTIISELQGQYVPLAGSTDEYRKSFMFDDTTGKTRDIIDLENLFKNVIPYLYSMQIYAGGYGDVEGEFGDEMIVDYAIYNQNKVSWLFRSNWVTKLLENPEYHDPATIYYYDSTGARVKTTVQNPLIPAHYTAVGRDMVFSKAQQIQAGLDDGDLSLVELKCIAVNEDIAKSWTLLLNYIGMKGMNREIMMRQMAMDATMIFNNEFSPYGVTNQSLALYPYTLDLRSISFDSVMKMLMLNVTKNTSYIYGDTMETLVTSSDIFTGFLLLVCAFCCSLVIPLIRNIALGLMFFLGYFAVIRSLLKDSKEKVEASIGYLGCHLLYLGINILYLLGFKMLMNMTTTEDVLTYGSTSVEVGNPVWCLIVVLILDGLFIAWSLWICKFCIKNYKDMGMAAMKSAVEYVGMGVSSGFEKMIGKLEGAAAVGAAESAGSGAKGLSDPVNQGGSSEGSSDSSGSGKRRRRGKKSGGDTLDSSDSSSGALNAEDFHYDSSDPDYVDNDPSDIDRTIERGRNNQSGNNQNGTRNQGSGSGSSQSGQSSRNRSYGQGNTGNNNPGGSRSQAQRRHSSYRQDTPMTGQGNTNN